MTCAARARRSPNPTRRIADVGTGYRVAHGAQTGPGQSA
ncbi:hypothetical protein SGUI_0460 [Serinicoccus hydrothermalis]|uniref:Uncharacterized protein n=1 Tax=Serinicoccus hydrothermalis TaxID=1758689 RepID=A0A1B1N8W1_9MICO|nr:hypothetical protein SGUI_0460 [Serinicoccus hydrothermalis]